MLPPPLWPLRTILFVPDGILFPIARFIASAGDFLSIAKERFTVVSTGFRPRCGVKTGTFPRNRLASSAPSACHSETSAHTGRGNPSLKTADETLSPPEWERQRVYCTVNSHYNPYRTKLLKVKEIQKPSVFGGIAYFCCCWQKYAAKARFHQKSPVGDTKEKASRRRR